MRLLTFSFLKKCKYLPVTLVRNFSSSTGSIKPVIPEDKSDVDSTELLEVCTSWPEEEEVELRANVLRDMQVLPNFVSEQEEASLMAEVDPYLRKLRYEFDHWDNFFRNLRLRIRWSKWARHFNKNERAVKMILAQGLVTIVTEEMFENRKFVLADKNKIMADS
ncbi:Alpha-ketoglutarate-dependent dioxygenase alkB homolog 7, mitochondrial [Eumeta japonica]|uniref:Alpha-ketoglutarate-dependent dioxygenase alkB homolog 7, mitochondrial n=1 Tax=Eumeta variegata TaxID=151549 RepID=A0A4C1U3F3_EUMVA|nr:Alpha-ketoglutarate-dependent dioxygenase alkB homolog 7, mitochondrial [Eumeta japonica]